MVDYTRLPVLVKHLALSAVDLDSADTHAAPALPRTTEASSFLSRAETLQSSAQLSSARQRARRRGLQLDELQPW